MRDLLPHHADGAVQVTDHLNVSVYLDVLHPTGYTQREQFIILGREELATLNCIGGSFGDGKLTDMIAVNGGALD